MLHVIVVWACISPAEISVIRGTDTVSHLSHGITLPGGIKYNPNRFISSVLQSIEASSKAGYVRIVP